MNTDDSAGGMQRRFATNEHKRTQKIFRKRNVVSRKGIKNTKVVGHRFHGLTQIIPQAEHDKVPRRISWELVKRIVTLSLSKGDVRSP